MQKCLCVFGFCVFFSFFFGGGGGRDGERLSIVIHLPNCKFEGNAEKEPSSIVIWETGGLEKSRTLMFLQLDP